MHNPIDKLLAQDEFTKEDIVRLLTTNKEDRNKIFAQAARIKGEQVGKKVYYRGLIEMSNICSKNCYYCGIRKGNPKTKRYNITDQDILDAAQFAYQSRYGSLVLQAGEISSPKFTQRITTLLKQIKELSNNELGITLSLGEQPDEVYQEWFEAGAHRYLLRIESSNPDLYYKIHPKDKKHDFETRLNCLRSLQKTGYQTGTGVMIGLPFQTDEDLAGDLLFMKDFDIDMCGMGPYIEHEDTPLYQYKHLLKPIDERFTLSLKMIAILRILMKDINIAAATALQAIDPIGREKAVKVGANVIMPNITPGMYRDSYKLYENKPCTDEDASDCTNCLEVRIGITGDEIGYGEWGDSIHFAKKK
ncbi:MAG: [FeFe] hydrogenase H-cluster radical SAM maturase HydE [Bacteroidales bacterium]|jgi:biotin synthase|nr:[FeFe] hydrogenase H-cluster radical SAM maturase HydE [Bacteroidales bacterium]